MKIHIKGGLCTKRNGKKRWEGEKRTNRVGTRSKNKRRRAIAGKNLHGRSNFDRSVHTTLSFAGLVCGQSARAIFQPICCRGISDSTLTISEQMRRIFFPATQFFRRSRDDSGTPISYPRRVRAEGPGRERERDEESRGLKAGRE